MRVLVDTCVWSLALRRSERNLSGDQMLVVKHLSDLIREGRVVLVGPVRQEVLSGIREMPAYLSLKARLRSFRDAALLSEDYEEAAKCSNIARSSGIAGSAVDFLLCAVSMRLGLFIFTTDTDFKRYSQVLPIRMHEVRKGQ